MHQAAQFFANQKQQIPLVSLNRATRRKQKLPFTLWKVVDIRTQKVVAISTWTAASNFVAVREPLGRRAKKMGNPYRVEVLDMTNPRSQVDKPGLGPEPVKVDQSIEAPPQDPKIEDTSSKGQ